MKPYCIMVPGSLITKQTAPGYLRRIAGQIFAKLDNAGCLFLVDIESRIVEAGFLTWDEVEDIELEAMLPF